MKHKLFTKDEIAKILDLWESKAIVEIAQELGRPNSSVASMAKIIRMAGYALPKKRIKSQKMLLVKEVLTEKGLI